MDDSWSWDGSLISLHSSMAASTSAASPKRGESHNSTSIPLPPPAALRVDGSFRRTAYVYKTPPAINTRPPSPVGGDSAPLSATAAPLSAAGDDHLHSPLAPPRGLSHPLASILLSDLSPPVSPATSNSSFPRSGSPRSRINSSLASASRPGRGRTRARRGSASSTTSTDGSAHLADEDSGASSAEDGHDQARAGASGLVMPSLSFDNRPDRSVGRSPSEEHLEPRINLLVLGKTAEDRSTLAALLADDQDRRIRTSSRGSDMSYSFVSSERPQRSRSASEASARQMHPSLEPIGSCGPAVTLSHPSVDLVDLQELQGSLRLHLEQLEAKLSRTYPASESLAALVALAGVGYFDACMLLFSSPPLPCEIAVASAISPILPILPILILPPAPTSKPQKTSALSHAVIQQLDSAGVRWLSILSLDRRESRSPPRTGCTKAAEICGGPLTMLPHDLFVQHSPVHPVSRDPSSGQTSSFPSPSSGPTSLTSSQELPPLSPTFTSFTASDRSSSRASSIRSLSPISTGRNTANLHRLTLQDLYRLRRILHSTDSPLKLRRARAETFLEWRDVEIAARGLEPRRLEDLPQTWAERPIASQEVQVSERRGLDFSKRVAERRKELGVAAEANDEISHQLEDDDDDGDVLDMDEADKWSKNRRFSIPGPYLQDPTTPKPSCRHLANTCSASIETVAPALSDSSSSSSASSRSLARSAQAASCAARSPSPSYFPYFPPAPLSSSIGSLSSSSDASNSSLLILRSSDPFHFPSLLHLVGLNLRLALFRPLEDERCPHPTEPNADDLRASSGRTWWRSFAMFTVVFAAGVVAGIQAVDRFERSGGSKLTTYVS
ncbi:uncharacterized protein JCM15063_001685 [Sporobolomyces koalae]|uniref:uncharacterized protein n=1 Tax=Sporobolomyces koalae TaxID=500713 RepID=UPI00317C53EC